MFYENLAVLKGLTQRLKLLLKKYKLVEDIIIFGSIVRAKSRPKDLDLALLVHQKEETILEKIEEEIQNELKEFKVDITVLTIKEVYAPIWLSIMHEGWSVKKEEFLPVLHQVQPSKLYKYSIKFLTPVQKVQFDRGLKKMIEKLQGIRIARGVILIPLEQSEQFEEFLKTWKLEFETKRYSLLPEFKKIENLIAN